MDKRSVLLNYWPGDFAFLAAARAAAFSRKMFLTSTSGVRRPELRGGFLVIFVDFSKDKQWFSSGHGFAMLESHH